MLSEKERMIPEKESMVPEKDSLRWQKVYEPAPEAFKRAMERALREREEPTMKRFSLRTAAIAVAVLIALTGVALAVTGQNGVLKFLFPDREPATELPVQTALPQAGGDALETITVKVRDAVSDGQTLHIAVEVAAKNPRDAVLYDLDAEYVYPMSGQEARKPSIPVTEEGMGFCMPFVSKAKEAERILIIGTPMALLGGVDLVKGTNWYYESPGVLVVDYVIDLRPGAYEGWDNPPPYPLPSPLAVTLTPSVWLQKQNDINCYDIEQAKVALAVDWAAQEPMELSEYVATNLPVEGEGYRLDAARFVSTPLGLYATLTFSDTDPNAGWESESPLQQSFWYEVLGADGQPLPALHGGYTKFEDPERMGTIQRIEALYPARALGETVTIRPFAWERGKFPDIQLTLKKQ